MDKVTPEQATVRQDTIRQDSEQEQGGTFFRHFLQMAVAMMVGMPLWHMFFGLVIGPLGFADEVYASPELWYGLMTFFMSVPMVAFMRYRGHSWARNLEMVAAMALPVAVVLLLWRSGAGASIPFFTERALSMVTHAAMYLGMFLIMLYRRTEYSR